MCVNAYIHMCQYSKTHYLSSGFFCCDEILWLKATWEGTGLFCQSSWWYFRAGVGVGEQEVLQEAVEKCYLLIALRGLLSLLSYSTQDWQPRCGITHSEPDPFLINRQSRKCTTGLPVGQSSRDVFNSAFLFQNDFSLYQVHKKTLANTQYFLSQGILIWDLQPLIVTLKGIFHWN